MDGTLNAENVPGMRPPPYKVEEGVNQIPVNGLANIQAWKTYVIIGSGKTGLDAICYLLDMNVNPDKIVWIVTNEMWCLNRKVYNMENLWSGMEWQFRSILESDDIIDAFLKFEEQGIMLRIDQNHWPTKLRAATINEEQLKQLRRVKNVIRQGRVKALSKDTIEFENGSMFQVKMTNPVFVDCTSRPGHRSVLSPVFQGDKINLQLIAV